MPKTLDYRIKKLEKGPLQRFKNQNAVLKKFGEAGLRLYKAANGKRSAEEIISELGLEPDFAAEVVAWLEDRGMIELSAVEGGTFEKPAGGKKEEEGEKPKVSEKRAKQETREEEELSVPKQRTSRLRELVEKEAAPKKRIAAEKSEEAPAEEEEIKPIEEEPAPAKEEEKAGEQAGPEKGEEEAEEEGEAEEEITPVEEEGEKVGEAAEEPATEGEAEAAEEEGGKEAEEEGIEPESEEKEEIKPEGEEEAGLNPVEKTIKEKYGDVGLRVYALIDGQKTAEEIMTETGVSEAKLIEMLEYMEKQGIIKLEHPEAKAAEEAEEEREKFAPLAEQMPEGTMKDLSPVEVPAKLRLDLVKGIQIKAQIALKLGERGNRVFEAIDGTASDVDLSMRLGIPLYDVRDMLSFLASNRIIATRPLNRDDIVHRYGEDCFSVYKKYGREGVLLYELIGKDIGIRQMAQLVTKERSKFAEMFIFVHKVLGVDIPIDKDVIFSQIGERK